MSTAPPPFYVAGSFEEKKGIAKDEKKREKKVHQHSQKLETLFPKHFCRTFAVGPTGTGPKTKPTSDGRPTATIQYVPVLVHPGSRHATQRADTSLAADPSISYPRSFISQILTPSDYRPGSTTYLGLHAWERNKRSPGHVAQNRPKKKLQTPR